MDEIFDYKAYSYKKGEWVLIKTLRKKTISELQQIAKEYHEKNGVYPLILPAGENPKAHPILFKMEKIVRQTLKSYFIDFYVLDICAYFKANKKSIWMLRKTGTDFVPFELISKDPKYFEMLVGANQKYYLVENEVLTSLTLKQVLGYLPNKVIAI